MKEACKPQTTVPDRPAPHSVPVIDGRRLEHDCVDQLLQASMSGGKMDCSPQHARQRARLRWQRRAAGGRAGSEQGARGSLSFKHGLRAQIPDSGGSELQLFLVAMVSTSRGLPFSLHYLYDFVSAYKQVPQSTNFEILATLVSCTIPFLAKKSQAYITSSHFQILRST